MIPLLKTGSTGKQVVQRATERIDVTALVGRVRVAGLFRTHVVDRAHDLTRLGQSAGRITVGFACIAGQSSEPQIEHFDFASLGQQQVVWFDVSVDDAGVVGGL